MSGAAGRMAKGVASKIGGLKAMKKEAGKKGKDGSSVHTPFLSTIIPAGQASASPPLGSQLGQRNMKQEALKNFIKDFNERTKNIKQGTPLPAKITVNPDSSYNLVLYKPPVSYYLRLAAGIDRGAMEPGNETAGYVTLRHIYEIASIKSEDPCWRHTPLEIICKSVIGTAHSCGIEVVKSLDPKWYASFLEERKKIVEEQREELQMSKEAKLQRLLEKKAADKTKELEKGAVEKKVAAPKSIKKAGKNLVSKSDKKANMKAKKLIKRAKKAEKKLKKK